MSEKLLRKSNKLANKHRENGNKCYKSQKFLKALLFYNQSLCNARPNSIEFSLGFANRSAVYFEIEAYEICIENIQLAISFGYPKERLHILYDRLERCYELLSCHDHEKVKSDFSLMKLSHPPHARLPFIADCIELRHSKEHGNHLITTRELKAGEIIAIEKPFHRFIMNDARFSHCANCLRSEKFNLFPCCKCNYTMFCSQECMTNRFHRYECKIELDIENESDIFQMCSRMVYESLGIFANIEELKEFVETKNLQTQKTIFDLDLSSDDNDRDKKLLLAINSSLQKNSIPNELNELMERHCRLLMSIMEIDEKHKQFLSDFMKQQMEILITNTFALSENGREIGSGIFPLASFFNSSCAPNLARITLDGQLIFIALRPIEKHQQLFVCYRGDFHQRTRSDRQSELLWSYKFKCECEACVNNYEMLENLPKHDKNFKEPETLKNVSTLDAIVSEFKKNCSYINDNCINYPSYELCTMIDRNQQLLNSIVCLTSSRCLKRD